MKIILFSLILIAFVGCITHTDTLYVTRQFNDRFYLATSPHGDYGLWHISKSDSTSFYTANLLLKDPDSICVNKDAIIIKNNKTIGVFNLNTCVGIELLKNNADVFINDKGNIIPAKFQIIHKLDSMPLLKIDKNLDYCR